MTTTQTSLVVSADHRAPKTVGQQYSVAGASGDRASVLKGRLHGLQDAVFVLWVLHLLLVDQRNSPGDLRTRVSHESAIVGCPDGVEGIGALDDELVGPLQIALPRGPFPPPECSEMRPSWPGSARPTLPSSMR
ncbi:hypothetical protein KR018_001124 [Drosophila ironensis]|nr:hypothetical protein KR018_001124 [Drosophila ironensis]